MRVNLRLRQAQYRGTPNSTKRKKPLFIPGPRIHTPTYLRSGMSRSPPCLSKKSGRTVLCVFGVFGDEKRVKAGVRRRGCGIYGGEPEDIIASYVAERRRKWKWKGRRMPAGLVVVQIAEWEETVAQQRSTDPGFGPSHTHSHARVWVT